MKMEFPEFKAIGVGEDGIIYICHYQDCNAPVNKGETICQMHRFLGVTEVDLESESQPEEPKES